MEKIIGSVQVPAPIENNNNVYMINKEENTMKNLSVAIVINNNAYTKKYDELAAYGIYELLIQAGEIAILSDDDGFFRTNSAELNQCKRVYGAPANARLEAYEQMYMPVEALTDEEEAELASMSRQQRREAQRELEKLQGVCAMRHWNLFTNERKTTMVFSSVLYRKVKSMGYLPQDVFVCLKTEIPEVYDNSPAELQQQVYDAKVKLDNIAANGLLFEGRKYKYFFAGASNARKCTTLFVREDLYATLGNWIMCGLKSGDMMVAPNKRDAYLGLTASATRPFCNEFGCNLDPSRVAIVPDKYVTVKSVVDFVDKTGNVTFDVLRNIEINAFDGMGTIRSEISRSTAFTMRSFWIKAAVFPTDFDAVCEKLGANKLVDVWGNEHNVEDLDVILTASCFKMWKLYTSWNEYLKHFNDRNAEFCVCVAEHALRRKSMSYQQGQTLQGDINDAEHFANKTKDILDSFKAQNKAVKLLPATMKPVVRAYPELLAHWYTNLTLQECYTSRRNEALGGKVLDIGYISFNAPDMVAFWQHVLGLEVEGILHAGQCLCAQAKGRVMDVTRNPHLDNAHVLLFNAKSKIEGYEAFFMGPTVYFNMYDLTTVRLRADYDGDHVFWSQDHDLINLVRKSADILGHRPIDWDAPEGNKTKISNAVLAEMLKMRTKASQIGIYADNLTKVWGNANDWLREGRINTEKYRKIIAYLTWAGNVLIDAAKHGSANVEMPKWMKDIMKDAQFPSFIEYAKANDSRPVGSDVWKEKCRETDSFLDMYTDFVEKNVSAKLEVEGVEDMIFDINVLLNDPKSKIIVGLLGTGIYNKHTGQFENEGLFAKIAFRSAKERNDIRKSDDEGKEKLLEALANVRYAEAYIELEKYAAERGYTMINVCDNVTRWLFKTESVQNNVKLAKPLYEMYFGIFGDMLADIAKRNLEAASV